MELFVTGDANRESGVSQIVTDLSGPTRQRFLTQDYGAGLAGIVVVLMCRDLSIKFHRRLRFARKNKTIYMDIMLDYACMVAAADSTRRRALVTERLANEISDVLGKYKIADFNSERFVGDLRAWLVEAMQLPYRQVQGL